MLIEVGVVSQVNRGRNSSLLAGVFFGGGIVDCFTGVDISSAACDFFAFHFTLNRSRSGSRTIRPRITFNLPASSSKII